MDYISHMKIMDFKAQSNGKLIKIIARKSFGPSLGLTKVF